MSQQMWPGFWQGPKNAEIPEYLPVMTIFNIDINTRKFTQEGRMDSSALACTPSPMRASAPAGRKGQENSQKVHASVTGTARDIRLHALARASARCLFQKTVLAAHPPRPLHSLARSRASQTPVRSARLPPSPKITWIRSRSARFSGMPRTSTSRWE